LRKEEKEAEALKHSHTRRERQGWTGQIPKGMLLRFKRTVKRAAKPSKHV